jgi:hypothetical protein
MINIHTTKHRGMIYPVAYKVVTQNLKSLGLRKNPNIIKYPKNKWLYLPEHKVTNGIGDFGGIWLARTLGSARKYQRYMREKHDTETRVFKSLVDRILFSNQDRVKTNGICMIEELFL